MKRSLPTSCKTGFTLPEIMVSLFLVSIVIAALGGLLRESVRFYTDQSITLEVQKNCIFALQRLGKDLREASPESFDTSTPNQIVFGSPRGENGEVEYDDGRLLWHKYVRYSIQDVRGSSVLMREVDLLDLPTGYPPRPSFSDFASPDTRAVQARLIDSLTVKLEGSKVELEITGEHRGIFEMSLQTELKLQN